MKQQNRYSFNTQEALSSERNQGKWENLQQTAGEFQSRLALALQEIEAQKSMQGKTQRELQKAHNLVTYVRILEHHDRYCVTP
jgi:hypothetical protein